MVVTAMKKINNIFTALLFGSLLLASCTPVDSDSSLSNESDDTSLSEPLSSEETSSEISSEVGENYEGIPTVVHIYYRNDAEDYTTYVPYYWWEGMDGKEYDWDDVFTHESGKKFAHVAVDNSEHQTSSGMSIIFKKKLQWDGQTKPDFFIDFSAYPKDENMEMSVWCVPNAKLEVESFLSAEDALGDTIDYAKFTSFQTINAKSRGLDKNVLPVATYWELYRNDEKIDQIEGGTTATFTLSADADLSDRYEVKAAFVSDPSRQKSMAVNPVELFDTQAFNNLYNYTGNDLGATYTSAGTTFKVWAPTSYAMSLRIYRANAPTRITGSAMDDYFLKNLPMTRGDKGVYSLYVEGDWHGRYYTYVVTNSGGTAEVCDPYAVSAGTNGIRGQILDLTQTDPEGFRDMSLPAIAAPTDLTVYEIHVQDLTTDDTWTGTEENRGKFLGLIEEGTTYTAGELTVKTGFDHIVELGVNTVQIMPFYDQANDETNPDSYNWGYNPQNYNVVEGGYSSQPSNGAIRVNEFKQVVQKFASKGIRVVMDVVYNHMASMSSSSFNRLVPDYFFRRDAQGILKNESGVGNDFATERTMASKFIVESVKFWAEEYQIKGFRFDLMSLIDDNTLYKIADEMALIDPEIVLWGEPWSGGGYVGAPKVYDTSLKNTNFAAFNDVGRNATKGNNNLNSTDGEQYGWLQKEPAHNAGTYEYLNKVKAMMSGQNGNYYDKNPLTRYNNPRKNVNYVGCHDNFSVFDQMLATNAHDYDLAKDMSLIANALVLTSLGIPFFQGGDEIMRTKVFDPTTEIGANFLTSHRNEAYVYDPTPTSANSGDEIYYSGNSYNLEASVNSYKWDDKISNLAYFELYQDLIALRKDHATFRLSSPQSAIVGGEVSSVGYDFNFWQDVEDLSASAIAAAYLGDEAPIYVFVAGRLYGGDTPGTSSATKQNIAWELNPTKSVYTRVLFDSANVYPVGSEYLNNINLSSYQIVVLERIV